jgi:hypothetical protein
VNTHIGSIFGPSVRQNSRLTAAITAPQRGALPNTAMSIEVGLRALEEKLDPLERVIKLFRLFTASLGEPMLRKSDGERGFRYEGLTCATSVC